MEFGVAYIGNGKGLIKPQSGSDSVNFIPGNFKIDNEDVVAFERCHDRPTWACDIRRVQGVPALMRIARPKTGLTPFARSLLHTTTFELVSHVHSAKSEVERKQRIKSAKNVMSSVGKLQPSDSKAVGVALVRNALDKVARRKKT